MAVDRAQRNPRLLATAPIVGLLGRRTAALLVGIVLGSCSSPRNEALPETAAGNLGGSTTQVVGGGGGAVEGGGGGAAGTGGTSGTAGRNSVADARAIDSDGSTPVVPRDANQDGISTFATVLWKLPTAQPYAAAVRGDVLVTTGAFEGTQDFGGMTRTSSDHEDIFVADYDISGKLVWVRSMGGKGYDFPPAVTIADNGDILLAGSIFSMRLSIEGGASQSLPSGHFLARFLPTSKLVWLEDGSRWPNGLAVDAAGDLLVAEWDRAVAKLDPAGTLIWRQDFCEGVCGVYAITSGIGDAIFAAEMFKGMITLPGFPPTTPTSFVSAPDGRDTLVARFTTTGQGVWVTRIAARATAKVPRAEALVRHLAADSQGDVYAWGDYSGALDLPGAPSESANDQGMFLVKLSGADGHILWSKVLAEGLGTAAGFGTAASVVLDAGGDVLRTTWGSEQEPGGKVSQAGEIVRYAGATGVEQARYDLGTPRKPLYGMQRHASGDLFIYGPDFLARVRLP